VRASRRAGATQAMPLALSAVRHLFFIFDAKSLYCIPYITHDPLIADLLSIYSFLTVTRHTRLRRQRSRLPFNAARGIKHANMLSQTEIEMRFIEENLYSRKLQPLCALQLDSPFRPTSSCVIINRTTLSTGICRATRTFTIEEL
jgi:hypothetical protein